MPEYADALAECHARINALTKLVHELNAVQGVIIEHLSSANLEDKAMEAANSVRMKADE